MRYFIHNLETDKLNIFTGGKVEWLALPEADRNDIKRACLWSRTIEGWVSRSKGHKQYLHDILIRCGFEDRGKDGTRLSFTEQIEAKQERAEQRADRYDDRADKANAQETSLYSTARTMADCIPFGQPILVGHYSEGRDRRFRDRISRTFERAFEEGDKAKYYERRAATARATSSGAQYSDPRYLGNRIKETKSTIALLELRLQGKSYQYSEGRVISAELAAEYTEKLDEQHEKLEFYQACLATCQNVFTKETLTGKQAIKIRGGWFPIVKLNRTTVAVPNTCFPQAENQIKYALKYAYTEVQDAR